MMPPDAAPIQPAKPSAPDARLPERYRNLLALSGIVAPMFLFSSAEVVVQACRAAIIGAMRAANARTCEALRRWVAKAPHQSSQLPTVGDCLRAACAATLSVERGDTSMQHRLSAEAPC